jgi:hypothetical protein
MLMIDQPVTLAKINLLFDFELANAINLKESFSPYCFQGYKQHVAL